MSLVKKVLPQSLAGCSLIRCRRMHREYFLFLRRVEILTKFSFFQVLKILKFCNFLPQTFAPYCITTENFGSFPFWNLNRNNNFCQPLHQLLKWLSNLPTNCPLLVSTGFTTVHPKLKWLGSPNWIVDNSKLDCNKFSRWLYEDSDFKVKIVLDCIVLISFWSNLIYFRLNLTNYQLNLTILFLF